MLVWSCRTLFWCMATIMFVLRGDNRGCEVLALPEALEREMESMSQLQHCQHIRCVHTLQRIEKGHEEAGSSAMFSGVVAMGSSSSSSSTNNLSCGCGGDGGGGSSGSNKITVAHSLAVLVVFGFMATCI